MYCLILILTKIKNTFSSPFYCLIIAFYAFGLFGCLLKDTKHTASVIMIIGFRGMEFKSICSYLMIMTFKTYYPSLGRNPISMHFNLLLT